MDIMKSGVSFINSAEIFMYLSLKNFAGLFGSRWQQWHGLSRSQAARKMIFHQP